MKLFKVSCRDCGHTWTDISKSYVCPNCWSVHTVLSESGQSLVGVVITAAIMSYLLMTMAAMAQYSFKINDTMVANSDMTAYLDQIRSVLSDPQLATASLSSNNVTQNITIYDPSTKAIISNAGYKQQPNNAWSVFQITAVKTAIPSRVNFYKITLTVLFQKDQKRVTGAKFSRRVIGDVYCTVSNNLITSCTGAADTQTMAQQLCTSMSMNWNTTTGACTAPQSNSNNNVNDGDCDHH